jgi:uncharacterized protein YjbJ (UPF0337 family)
MACVNWRLRASSGDTKNLLTKKIRRKNMKPSTQDRTEGKIHEVKGKIKEEVGKATDDPDWKSQASGKERRQSSKLDRPR